MIVIFIIGFMMGGVVGATMAAILNIAGEDREENKKKEEKE